MLQLQYQGKPVQIDERDQTAHAEGMAGVWYLAKAEYVGAPTAPHGPQEFWRISRRPYVARWSSKPTLRGWIGRAFDVDDYAHGRVYCSLADDGWVQLQAMRDE